MRPAPATRIHQGLIIIGAVLAGMAVVGLATVTMADIVARQLGLKPVSGMIELSNMAVLFLGFFGLSYCFAVGGHIVVDIATFSTPQWFNRMLDRIWNIVAALFLLTTAYLVCRNGFVLHASGERSASLQWSPLTFHIPAVIGLVLAAVTCVVLSWRGTEEHHG